MRLRWPRFQFSLRTFLIVTALMAAVIGVHVRRRQYYAKRAEAVKKIEKLGWQFDSITTDRSSWRSRWDQYWYGTESLHQYEKLSIDALFRYESDVSAR